MLKPNRNDYWDEEEQKQKLREKYISLGLIFLERWKKNLSFLLKNRIPLILDNDNPNYEIPDDKNTLDQMEKLNEEHKNKMMEKK